MTMEREATVQVDMGRVLSATTQVEVWQCTNTCCSLNRQNHWRCSIKTCRSGPYDFRVRKPWFSRQGIYRGAGSVRGFLLHACGELCRLQLVQAPLSDLDDPDAPTAVDPALRTEQVEAAVNAVLWLL